MSSHKKVYKEHILVKCNSPIKLTQRWEDTKEDRELAENVANRDMRLAMKKYKQLISARKYEE